MEKLSRPWRTRGGLLAMSGVLGAVAGLVLAAVFGGAGASSASNPPGNNGTVKIDDMPFDDHPDNEPHVGCVFQVDFYGFDEGDLFADVIFEVHPPTRNQENHEEEHNIAQHDNSGGGSEAGLDASVTYDLSALLQGFEPHPQQGWHVKLTIHADGSQGADVKHKVFWVSGCEAPPPTTTTTSTTTTSTTTTSTTTTVPPTTSTTGSTTTTEPPTTSTTGSTTTTTYP
ncbi:MAG: hypothetical protein ACRD0W_12020 [Acidimicrobiales bacterium]